MRNPDLGTALSMYAAWLLLSTRTSAVGAPQKSGRERSSGPCPPDGQTAPGMIRGGTQRPGWWGQRGGGRPAVRSGGGRLLTRRGRRRGRRGTGAALPGEQEQAGRPPPGLPQDPPPPPPGDAPPG